MQKPIARRGSNVVSFSPPRIIDQRFEKVSYFVFGDFNFRLDSKSVVEVGTAPRRGGSLRRSRRVSGKPQRLCLRFAGRCDLAVLTGHVYGRNS